MIKKYNGSSWVSAPVKKYNGSSWDFADVRHYDGSDWLYLNPVIYDEDLTNGLVSYYSFDDNANDIYGSNDGTVVGATHTSSGKVDGAYSFDGSNDYIKMDSDSGTVSSFTFSLWVNTITEATSSIDEYFLEAKRGSTVVLAIDNNNPDGFSYYDGNEWITTSPDIVDGNWHHLVLVKDGTNVEMYVDNTRYVNQNGNSISLDKSLITVGINNDVTDPWYKGKIDEIGFWSRALSSTEVSKLYNYGVGRHGG